jgi:branched-chain amino acid transport system permease protein
LCLKITVVWVRGVDWARLLVNFWIYFGLMLIVTLSINWIWGWAGLPFLGSSVPVLVGGFTVSAVTCRVVYLIASAAGAGLLPWGEEGWIINSEFNSGLAEQWLKSKPLLCIALIFSSLVLAFILGGVMGWLVARPGLGRGTVYVGIASFVLSDLIALLGREVAWFSGGAYGVFIPDLLVFTGGAGVYVLLGLVLLVSALVFLLFRLVKASPFGRTVVAVRDSPVAASGLGKNVVVVRGWAVFLGSGAMGVAGCLYAVHRDFVFQGNYGAGFWTMWPLLMALVGGFTGDAGVVLGVLLVQGLRYLLILNSSIIRDHLFFPLAYLESLELGALMLVFLTLYPRGLKRFWAQLEKEPTTESNQT